MKGSPSCILEREAVPPPLARNPASFGGSTTSRRQGYGGPPKLQRMRKRHRRRGGSRAIVEGMEDAMQRRGEFRVSVTKDDLVFASAHFITFSGHRCEGLHGHNYRAHVTLEGELDEESWWVFDFVTLKKIMRRLCDEIDHKVLLPLQNPRLQVAETGESVAVAYDGTPRYLFPRRDCALLPIPNTTVEMLAELLAGRLRAELESMGARGLTAMEMEIEENFGQSAFYRIGLR